MYIENFKNLRPESLKKLDDVKRFNFEGAPVSQFDSQDFNINDCGFVRNDLSVLMRAQSQSEYEMRLKSLQEIDSSSLPDDMSIEDALATIIPRYTQSPSELALFAEQLAQRDMRTLDDAYRQALKDKDKEKDSAPATSPTSTVESPVTVE